MFHHLASHAHRHFKCSIGANLPVAWNKQTVFRLELQRPARRCQHHGHTGAGPTGAGLPGQRPAFRGPTPLEYKTLKDDIAPMSRSHIADKKIVDQRKLACIEREERYRPGEIPDGARSRTTWRWHASRCPHGPGRGAAGVGKNDVRPLDSGLRRNDRLRQQIAYYQKTPTPRDHSANSTASLRASGSTSITSLSRQETESDSTPHPPSTRRDRPGGAGAGNSFSPSLTHSPGWLGPRSTGQSPSARCSQGGGPARWPNCCSAGRSRCAGPDSSPNGCPPHPRIITTTASSTRTMPGAIPVTPFPMNLQV